jgi:FAD/FMN-containing dehydrogenase
MSRLPEKIEPALTGWGRWPASATRMVRPERFRDLVPVEGPQIARGQGRAYGDAATNAEGTVILTERLNRFLDFDPSTGLLRAESGATLREIIQSFLPRGWFLPVTPGTSYCSVGGCLAADVHGKNHHAAGSFSAHVRSAEIALASGEIRRAEPQDPLFWATAGGMGLTGIIRDVEIQLRPVETPMMSVRHLAVKGLEAMMESLSDPANDDEYSVAWIDCLARGEALGRGVVMLGRHAREGDLPIKAPNRARACAAPQGPSVPFEFPSWALNPFTIRRFNEVFGWAQSRKGAHLAPVWPYFYPLDAIRNWPRMYGRRGFLQHQWVAPEPEAKGLLQRVLREISEAGHASFLAVLKKMGPEGQGMLSFPKEGYTLSLDIPMRPGLLEFLDRIDQMVLSAGGRIYLAKDSRMKAELIPEMHPRLEEFRSVLHEVDPDGIFQSDLSRRLQLR